MTSKSSHRFIFDFFAPLYDIGVWLIALPFGGEEGLRSRVVEAAEPLDGVRALEVFAGTSTLSLKMAERGARPVAVDISTGMLRVAREKAAKAGLALELVRAGADGLPFGDASFDRVVISLGLHEATAQVAEEALGEAYRVLAPGGKAVIFDHHRAEGRAGYIQKLAFLFLEGEEGWEWLKTDVQGLLGRTGFVNFRRTFPFSRAFQLITVEKSEERSIDEVKGECLEVRTRHRHR